MPCNTIYPDESLRRWEVCQSIDILTNYYTKQQIDEKLDDIVVSGSGVTVDEVQEIVDENLEDYYTKEEIDSGFTTVNNELDTKLDASAYTPTDLSNYYTKQQTNGLLDNKLDASAYTPTDLSNYWTSAQTKNYVDTAISGIPSNILAVDWEGLTSNMNDDKWDSLVDAFQNNNPIYAIVDYSGEGFIDIDQKPIDGYVFIDGNTGEQGSRIELKRLTGGGYDWITITKNDSNDYTVTNGNVQYTPTDLSNYWTSAQTKNYVDTAISNIPSGALAVDWSELVDQQLMTDAKWNEIVDAIQNHREVYGYLDYSADGGGVEIYPLISAARIGIQGSNDSIILNSQSGDGTYILTITKNGSNDYSFSDSSYRFQPKLIPGSGISISNNNVISVTGGTSGTIDQSLDSGSTNAVANSAITAALDDKMDVSGMTQYATTANTYTKTEVNNIINNKIICLTQRDYDSLITRQSDILYLIYDV